LITMLLAREPPGPSNRTRGNEQLRVRIQKYISQVHFKNNY
jgi:hypothetical protein